MYWLILGGLFLGLGPSVWLTDHTSESLQLHLQFFRMATDGEYVVWQPSKYVGSPQETAQLFWQSIRRRRWRAEEKIVINFSRETYGSWMELRAINPEKQTMTCTSNTPLHPSARAVLVALGCRWKEWDG